MSYAGLNLLNLIQSERDSLSKSDKKIAQVILDDPERATQSSIAVLARAAEVSEPTVNRFCKRFDTRGFPEFKLRLAQSLASGIRYVSQTVNPDDSVESYTHKIFDSTISSLALVRDKICLQLINQIVDQLIQAKHIYFFGLGASSSVAKDAEHKFFRFNLPVVFHEDVLMQRMLASVGSTGDVFFIISYTGRTKELVEIAELAKSGGATVISLTAPKSPLSELSHFVIEVETAEDTDVYMPMTSRIVQLVILDVLATGVTIKRGTDFQPHLQRIKESLGNTRL